MEKRCLVCKNTEEKIAERKGGKYAEKQQIKQASKLEHRWEKLGLGWGGSEMKMEDGRRS